MSTNEAPVKLNILDKEYRVACPIGEEESLHASAHLLNARIQEVQDRGKAIGTDRVAVMAALNLANDFLAQKNDWERSSKSFYTRIRSLQDRIDLALKNTQQLEL
jgi:cell division protein ZapA